MPDAWWLPRAISSYASAHDVQFTRTLIITAAIFVASQFGLALTIWRYRARDLSPVESKRSGPRLELVWIATTAAVFIGLLGMGARTWASVQFSPAPSDAEAVEVLAKQFAWSFRYPGKDGRFGRTDPRMVNEAGGNPFGLDEGDAAGKDDIVSATLRVPMGRPVQLTLRSLDVIHNFYVRELRIKQDLVPGMQIPLHFQADVPGTYEVPCAELCGLGHHQMRTTMTVMPPSDFDAWKRGQSQ